MTEIFGKIPAYFTSLRTVLESDSSLETVFWGAALIGSSLFVMRVFLLLLGIGDHDAMDAANADGDFDGDAGLHIFSLATVTSFFMMFGWCGLAAFKGYGVSELVSILIASVCGICTMILLAFLMRFIFSLGDKGDTFKPEDVVGTTGEVFEKINEDGKGMVFVMYRGVRREFIAAAEDKKEIPSFTKVKILKLIGTDTVVVQRII